MGGRSGQSIARAASASTDTTSIGSVEERIRTQPFESAALYIDGRQSFFKDGTASRVYFTREEAEAMKGGVLTHNHPGGRSFSDLDILILNYRGLAEIRAVSSSYTYILKNEKGTRYADRDLAKQIKSAERKVRKRLQSQINAHEISPDFASQTFHHEVNLLVAKATGFTYIREDYE